MRPWSWKIRPLEAPTRDRMRACRTRCSPLATSSPAATSPGRPLVMRWSTTTCTGRTSSSPHTNRQSPIGSASGDLKDSRGVIGVPLRPLTSGQPAPKLALNRAYFDALETAGAIALPIPITHDADRLRFYYELLDGLLLPGGADVEPRRYGAVARDDCNLTVRPDLDEAELRLARWAIADGLPVLGICRGIQVLNVACEGTLWQDVNVEGATHEDHDREPRDLLVHGLDVEPGTLLARTLGETHLRVNSLHHQAIRDLGPPLQAGAH